MALIVRSQRTVPFGFERVRTWHHLSRATATIPQTAARSLFTITGGRILVHYIVGEVTTIIETATNNYKLSANPTTGTTGIVGTNHDITGLEVGTLLFPQGDGTELIGVNAGVGFPSGSRFLPFICPVGVLEEETSASKTGAIKWDLWYEELDEDAVVIVSA